MQKQNHTWGQTSRLLAVTGVLLFSSSCDHWNNNERIATIGGPVNPKNGVDHIDPTLDLTRQDYRHIAAVKNSKGDVQVTIEKDAPPIPKLAEILAAPRPPKIGETQLVSIAVTDDVPLKDVLLELAKLADVDIELDAGITGGIEFIAKDKPFNEVIDRIAELAGLRYTMKNGVLRVERDTPFIKSYSVDFLNLDRDSDSSVNLSTNVLSSSVGGAGGGGSSGLNTGSTSSVKSTTKGDFWKSLETGVQQVLSYQAPAHISATTMQAETDANVLGALTGAAATSTTPPAPGTPPVAGTPATPGTATKTTTTTTTAPVTPAGAAANNSSIANGLTENKTSYTINRQAGVLTVNGTEKQQELIQILLDKLKSNASAQVLIEGKIVEVDLNEQYESGINWSALSGKLNAVLTPVGVANALSATQSIVSFSANSDKDVLSLIEQFGATRTISSPRLHAINNQQSTMTFAKNAVYFQVTVTPGTTTTTGSTSTIPTAPTVSSTAQTVPIGVMMTMMPSIDLADDEVTLSVRPTLSTIIDFVPDPTIAFEVAQACQPYVAAGETCPVASLTNNIPEVQVRELDSTLKLKSGQTMVIGGLMQQNGNNTDTGLPFFGSIPVLGNLFKGVNKTATNSELVLLIKATIVDSRGSLNPTDQNIFHKFSDDPRPVSF